MLNGKSILVTGGTGSFGHKFAEVVLKNFKPEKFIRNLFFFENQPSANIFSLLRF